ncbi:transport protein particle complex II subunit [Saccharomycopsis crataegensis]|uniref:Transport protein particle complex II subunit n=1 Tax=Saccharomycopsis crataegensis TaxID=43959 RepID=A0AAV5QNB9_9ASCO|nr:transport protein particle complex II subunit [Saccharomycopsis crataegensis]
MSTIINNEPSGMANIKKVKISYYDPFSVYPKIQKDLDSKLPLTNLHWKASEKSPLRSIPCLDVELVEEIPKSIKSTPLVKTIDDQMQKKITRDPVSLLKRASTIMKTGNDSSIEGSGFDLVTEPIQKVEDSTNESALTDLTKSINDSYLKIMFFEAQNIDQYKSNVRPFIKEWFKQSIDSSKLPTDWLLVFYLSQGGKDDYTTAFKYGLLDKIKLDFNNYKNGSFLDDHAPSSSNSGVNSTNALKILKIKHDYANTTEYNQGWNALFSSIKTGVLNTFTERINFFEYKIDKFLNSCAPPVDDVKSKRISKIDNGPNFASEMNIGLYFLMNENLGILYHDLSLYEDSLTQYDNLQKIFQFYLQRHGDSNLPVKFLNEVGFESNFEQNPFYFNIFKSIKESSFNEGEEKVHELSNSTYEQIAPMVFESLTNFNNSIFDQLRKRILNNAVSYFDLKNYFFLKEITLINSILFNSFSQLSSTPSVNSVYIHDLLKRLKTFVVDTLFGILNFKSKEASSFDTFKLIEYCFTMVDNYLLFINEYFFKPPQKASNNQYPNLPPLGNKAHSVYSQNKDINDTIGELRLIQRFFLVMLGKFYEYKLDNIFIDKSVDYKLSQCISQAEYSTEAFQFDHPLLTRVFKSFENYGKYFKYLTESAIGNFNVSDKPRTVDILSIDIALLNYQIGNYTDSLNVLLNCPNFYNEQGWEYIGFYLLQVFINCLEKVMQKNDTDLQNLTSDDKDELEKLAETVSYNKVLLCKSYLDLISTLIDSSNPAAGKMTEISLSSESICSNSNFVNNNLENINKYLTNPSEIDRVIKKLLSLKNEISLEYDVSKIFKYKIDPFVNSQEKNSYNVEIEVDNFAMFLTEVGENEDERILDFDKIELVLQNIVDRDEVVKFSLDKADYNDEQVIKDKFYFKKGKNKFALESRDIIVGRFGIKELKIAIGGITLVKNHISTRSMLFGQTETDGSVKDNSVQGSIDEKKFDDSEDELIYDFKTIILIHPYISNVHFELKNPLKLNLNYKQFLLKINVGDFEIEQGTLEFSTESDGFQLIGNDLQAVSKKRVPKYLDSQEFDYDDDSLFDSNSIDPIEISAINNNENDQIIYKIGKVTANSIVEITIPYAIKESKTSAGGSSAIKNLINLKTKMTYTSDNKEHSLTSYQDLNTTLTIAVSVQDTFKSDRLFSKFSVGTADLRAPIRILSTDLLSNEKYNTSTSMKTGPLVAFGEQPVSYFFKIEPVEKDYITKEKDSLKLIVNYRNLSEEIFEGVWKYFKETYLLNRSNETQKNHISKYILLLKDYLFKLLRFDLNEYALFNNIKIKHFDILEFAELFAHFFPEDRSKYLEIFKKFIDSLKQSKLDLPIEDFKYINSIERHGNEEIHNKETEINDFFKGINRELFISVAIPLVQVVHNIHLEFDNKSQYVVGEPITSTFKIQSLVNWRGDKDANDSVSSSEKGQKKKRVAFEDPNKDSMTEHFQLDFVGPQENWLISGKKKFQFSVNKQGENGNSKMCQNDIELFLIPLKIGKLVLPKIEIKSINNHLNDDFSMEVDYKNSSQTILVVPNLDRVTFAF